MAIEKEEKMQDLRIRRTRKLLINALKSLLTERSFSEIHITDICDRAMVHRTTFYKHFLDKYDLLNFALTELQENFDNKIQPIETFDCVKEYFMCFFRQVLEYMTENKKMYLIGLRQLHNDAALEVLNHSVTERINQKLDLNRSKEIRYKVPTEIIAEFYVGALFSMANWWLEKEMKISVNEMVRYAELMIVDEHFITK